MWKKIWKKIRTLLRVVLLIVLIVGSIILSEFLGNRLRLHASTPCYVPGYQTIFCQRLESETEYLWNVIVERKGDTVVIQFKTSKLRRIYL